MAASAKEWDRSALRGATPAQESETASMASLTGRWLGLGGCVCVSSSGSLGSASCMQAVAST